MTVGVGIRRGTALAMLLCGLLWCQAERPAPVPATLQPAAKIPVAPLGYMPPSDFYLTYRLSSTSLGFFDDEHLLFTFRVVGLMKRIPGDPADDDDQQIRAVVLDLGTGHVLQQTEWRMHDRSQYLWPFSGGKFLVRVRDSLFLTDRSLQLQPYLTFPSELRVVQVSPDRKLLAVQMNDPAKLETGPSLEEIHHAVPVKIWILSTDSKKVIAMSDAHTAAVLPLMGNGLLDVLEGRKLGSWAMRDVPFQGDPRIFAEVSSTCQPTVQPLSGTTVLVAGCYAGADDRPVYVLSTTDGKELWQDRWQNRYIWPWFDYAQDGSRFVYESISVGHPISSFEPLYPQDVTAQLAGVYDTASGKLVLVKDASPVLTAGQNAVLSPDGKRFAVLRNGAIEVYDLPPVTPPTQPEALAKRK